MVESALMPLLTTLKLQIMTSSRATLEACLPEWNLLRELFSAHGYFKAVSEVYVYNLTTLSIQHEIRGMSTKQRYKSYVYQSS